MRFHGFLDNEFGASPLVWLAEKGFLGLILDPFHLSVGQANYFANTTMHQEALPVTVDIIAAKGCDLMIAQLAQDLVAAGIISVPLTGGTIYGGDILLKREAEARGMGMRYVG